MSADVVRLPVSYRGPRITIDKLQGRFGRFFISDKAIELWPDSVQAVMGECIVISAHREEIEAWIHYLAVSEQFDVVQEGAPYPLYVWELGGAKPIAKRFEREGPDAA